jgi:hypothetical protein
VFVGSGVAVESCTIGVGVRVRVEVAVAVETGVFVAPGVSVAVACCVGTDVTGMAVVVAAGVDVPSGVLVAVPAGGVWVSGEADGSGVVVRVVVTVVVRVAVEGPDVRVIAAVFVRSGLSAMATSFVGYTTAASMAIAGRSSVSETRPSLPIGGSP